MGGARTRLTWWNECGSDAQRPVPAVTLHLRDREDTKYPQEARTGSARENVCATVTLPPVEWCGCGCEAELIEMIGIGEPLQSIRLFGKFRPYSLMVLRVIEPD